MKKNLVSGVLVFLLTFVFILTGPVTSLAEGESEEAAATDPGTISLDLKNADIRDALSILAINLDSSIILTITEPLVVNFTIKDAMPITALDYLLKTYGLEYIKNGSTIVVGTRERLAKDFFNQMALTKFSLKYVPSNIISAQIDTLGIPVQKITLSSNQNSIWIQGLPQDLGKVRELISLLDRAENGSAVTSTAKAKLTPITLTYITAEQLNDMIYGIGLQPGMYLDANPKTLYVYATSAELAMINELKNKVDTVQNQEGTSYIFVMKKLNYIQAEEALPIIYQFGLNVDVITFPRSAQAIWLLGDEETIAICTAMIDQIDIKQNAEDRTFYVHKLTNITAMDAITRLQMLAIPEVKAYSFGYPQFSKNLLVSCPEDYRMYIAGQLNSLDVANDKIKVPVDFADDHFRLTVRRDLLASLTGISVGSFTISQNISRVVEPYFVLILEESPEKIKMVEDMITKLDDPLTNEYEPEYETVITKE